MRDLRAGEIVKMRERLGMTQAEFAATFHLSLSTLRKWEQGNRQPTGPAGLLLFLLSKIPDEILRAIGGHRSRPGGSRN
jgi:putative transcriptional regulator